MSSREWLLNHLGHAQHAKLVALLDARLARLAVDHSRRRECLYWAWRMRRIVQSTKARLNRVA